MHLFFKNEEVLKCFPHVFQKKYIYIALSKKIDKGDPRGMNSNIFEFLVSGSFITTSIQMMIIKGRRSVPYLTGKFYFI